MIHDLATMTWPEIRRAAETGATALLPTGSFEQHGRQLPVRTDTTLVESVASRAAERAAQQIDVAVAPCLWIGASNHHRPFFALSLGERTYIDALVDIFSSFEEAGFTHLFVLNGHGGNTSPLRVALSLFKNDPPTLLVAAADYWSLAAGSIRDIRDSSPGGAAHAGEVEVSLMHHVDPSAVRSDAVRSDAGSVRPNVPERFVLDLIDGGAVGTNLPWRTLSADGNLGDAHEGTKEKGAAMLEAAAEAAAQTLVSFAAM